MTVLGFRVMVAGVVMAILMLILFKNQFRWLRKQLVSLYNKLVFWLSWNHRVPLIRVLLVRNCALAPLAPQNPATLLSLLRHFAILLFLLVYAQWLLLEGAFIRDRAQKIWPRSKRLGYLLRNSFPPFTPEAYQEYYLTKMFGVVREHTCGDSCLNIFHQMSLAQIRMLPRHMLTWKGQLELAKRDWKL